MKKSLIHLPGWSLPQALGRRQQHWTKAAASLASVIMGMGQKDPQGEWYGSNSPRVNLGTLKEGVNWWGNLPWESCPSLVGIYHTDHGSASRGITKGVKCRLVEVQAGQQWVVFSWFSADFSLSMDSEVPLSGISEGEAQWATSSQL